MTPAGSGDTTVTRWPRATTASRSSRRMLFGVAYVVTIASFIGLWFRPVTNSGGVQSSSDRTHCGRRATNRRTLLPAPRTHSDTWRQVMRRPALVTWAIYLLLIPLYIFPSGLPQLGDVLVLIVVPLALRGWNGKLGRDMRATLRALIWFTAWVCLVDYAWVLVMGSYSLFGPDSFMLFPLYYIHNALIFLVALVLYRRFGDLFLRATVIAVMAIVFVQVGSSIVVGIGGSRGVAFFNNPNQLGYYALLAATLIALTQRRLQLNLLLSSLALVCCGALAVISASRAAAGGVGVLLVLMLFS